MDVAATVEHEAGERGATALRVCALLCDATASSIARLRRPDVEPVAEALLACRLACRAAGEQCRRQSAVACCDECADACGACAAICESLLARTELAAA